MKSKIYLLISLLFILVLLCIVYNKLSYTYPHNSDDAVILLQAKDMLKGNIFLKDWSLPPDTFWTLDIPFYSILTILFGSTPKLMYHGPAIIYAFIVLAVILLTKNCGNTKKSYINIIIALTIVGLPSAFLGGLISQGPIHLGTILVLLVSFIILDDLERHTGELSFWRLGLFFISMFLANTGDPLALYIGVLPIALTYIYKIASRDGRNKSLSIITVLILAILVSKVTLIDVRSSGGFNSLPINAVFVSIEKFPYNLSLTIQGILLLFGTDFFGQPLTFLTVEIMARSIGMLYVFYSICKVIRYKKDYGTIEHILVLGIVIDLISYLFSNQPINIESTRYLLPIIIYGAILAGRLEIPDFKGNIHKIIIMGICLVYLISFLPRLSAPIPFAKEVELVHFLEANNLEDGYGAYWNSHIVTVESNNDIKVRPVVWNGSDIAPFNWLSSEKWYTDENTARFLVFDSSNWGNVNLDNAKKTFGKPAGVYKVEDYTILVWNYNISQKLGR